MQHVYSLDKLQLDRQTLMAIGVFDGLHRGHQHLIRELVQAAHDQDKMAAVMTFYPHPDVIIRGGDDRYDLTTVDERAQILADLGVDWLVTHPFNRDVMQIRALAFVDQLVSQMRMSALWVGKDFALGYKREGNIEFLRAEGQKRGFDVRVIDFVNEGDERVSSSAIRRALLDANIEHANHLLGRSYNVTGEVIHGEKRGRDLGYPTANIEVPPGKLIPANGVYAGWASLNGERYMAATNVGISPTFMNKAVTVEAYLMDFERDIYGEMLTITFEKYLRPEQRFDGLEALIEQMGRDVAVGREFLSRSAQSSET